MLPKAMIRRRGCWKWMATLCIDGFCSSGWWSYLKVFYSHLLLHTKVLSHTWHHTSGTPRSSLWALATCSQLFSFQHVIWVQNQRPTPCSKMSLLEIFQYIKYLSSFKNQVKKRWPLCSPNSLDSRKVKENYGDQTYWKCNSSNSLQH